MTLKLVSFIAAFMLICTAETFGQKVFLSGYTRDSVTFDLLPYTTIHTTKGKPLAASNENGYFSLTIMTGDTIVFTRLGYKPVKIAPVTTSWDMNVMMPETAAMLQQIVVYDNYVIHGHEQIQKALREDAVSANSKFKNQTMGPNATNLIPTFGPGMVINGALSKLFGVDREQRKVSANKAELVRTQVYYEVVQSMTTKQYITGLLNLSDADYSKGIQKFKIDYPNAVYLQSREEIIRLMVESFATKR
jgi:hypothetical protein